MGGFVARCGTGVDNVTVHGGGVEKVGGEAGSFVLKDEETAGVGG